MAKKQSEQIDLFEVPNTKKFSVSKKKTTIEGGTETIIKEEVIKEINIPAFMEELPHKTIASNKSSREFIESLGIKILDETLIEDMLYKCSMPEGWKRKENPKDYRWVYLINSSGEIKVKMYISLVFYNKKSFCRHPEEF